MRAFCDRTGHVKLWLHPHGVWLLDVHGQPLALVHGDGVYDLKGRFAGWWSGAEVRDGAGLLVLADIKAVDLKDLMPGSHPRPIPPVVKTAMPVRPTLGLRPSARPNDRWDWADASAFLNKLVLTKIEPSSAQIFQELALLVHRA